MRYANPGLVLAVAAMFSGWAEAAAIRTMRAEIPFAFEENRGQSPGEFRYALVHQNAGFSCGALYARTSSLPTRVPQKLIFVGANSGCLAEIADPLSSYSNFYRGVAKSASAENVRHYGTIRFRNVWPGVDIRYNAVSSGYVMMITAASAAALAQVRLSGSPYGAGVDPSNGNVYSPVGSFEVTGPVRAVFHASQQEIGFMTSLTGAVAFTLTAINLIRTPAAPLNFAVDPDGSLYFAGSTTSYSELDATAATCLQGGITNACPDVYVAKFDPSGVFQYLIYLQGDRYETARHIESDAGGNIYVAGTTLSHDFATTAGAYQERYQGPETATVEFRSYVGGDVFLAKLHGPTGGLIYSTLFGGSGEDNAFTMRVDVFGRTYVGVSTRSQDLPRKGPQTETAPTCASSPVPGGRTTCYWLISLDENGSELRYAQQSSAGQFGLSPQGTLFYNTWTPIAQDGSTYSTMERALWSDGSLRYSRSFENEPQFGEPGPDESRWAIRAVRDPQTSAWVRSELIRLGPNGEGPEVVKADLPVPVQIAVVDSQNRVWVSGNVPNTPDAPLRSCQGCGGIALLDTAGNLLFGTALPLGGSQFRVSNGVLYAGSSFARPGEPSLAVVDRSAAPEPILASILDADSRGFSLLPGNVLALSGSLIGPDTPVYRPLARNGRLATEFGGYRVLFDDHAAPIWSASRDRLVVQIPLVQATPWSTLTIEENGKPLITRGLMAAFARGPIILAGPNPPDESFVIRNEDRTANSVENPAALGSVVSFLVAGVGETDPPLVEGELTHAVLAKPRVTPAVSFSLGSPNAEVISYQQAEDQPAGIMEMRVRLPERAPGNGANAWALFFVDPRLPIPATSQFPLQIYIQR